MNLILVEPHEVSDGSISLHDRRAEHVRKVLRSGVGDTLRVGIINGPLGIGTITRMDKRQIVLTTVFDEKPPPPPDIDIILALPRPIMLKRVLSQAASLGCNRIFIINANRVEKSFFHASIIREEAFTDPLRKGLEQSVDTRLPQVRVFPRFRPFVEDVLPQTVSDIPARLVAHPGATANLSGVLPAPVKGKVIIAIGPEGGWVDFEVEKFQETGFSPFSLGQRILRVDTVVPFVMGQISLLRQYQPEP